MSQRTYELTIIRNAVDQQNADYLAEFEGEGGRLGNATLLFFLPPHGFDELVRSQGIEDPRSLSFQEILALESGCQCIYVSILVEDETAEDGALKLYEGELKDLLAAL